MAALALIITMGAFSMHAHAQDIEYNHFAWNEANLGLFIPSTWTAANVETENQSLRLDLSDEGVNISLRTLPETTSDNAFYDRVYTSVVDMGLPPITWVRETQFGRFSGRIDAGDGVGLIMRLPDDRPLIMVGSPRNSVLSLLDTLMFSTINRDDGGMTADTPHLGTLVRDFPEQTWYYDGRAGEIVTISAVDVSRINPLSLNLDMEIVVYRPDGTELESNDDHGGADLYGVYDAQIRDLFLPDTGRYRIVVRAVQNTTGNYVLGVSGARPFTFDENGIARLSGRIQSVFPRQRWQFEGREGQLVTITMQTESGTLDPILELYSPTGRQTAYNDDAADPALGVNAQIVRAELPRDGIYTLDATRYSGTGAYSLVVTIF